MRGVSLYTKNVLLKRFDTGLNAISITLIAR